MDQRNLYNIIIILVLSICICVIAIGCNDEPEITYDPFIDAEGNEYPIGKMCDGRIWMLKNLSISEYRNGEPIPYVYQDDWEDIPNRGAAHCTYADSFELEEDYGHLYNWYAVSDPRGLAPVGWHVPTLEEWQELIDCNGGNEVAGDRLKEAG